ncbi:MAG: hypothetical protein ACRCXL_10095 [Dermatophilaceae bacterium]
MMRGQVRALLAVADVFDRCPEASLTQVHLGWQMFLAPGRPHPDKKVQVAVVWVFGDCYTAAETLAGMFGLVEVDDKDDPPAVRNWSGWVPDACREVPVQMKVTAIHDDCARLRTPCPATAAGSAVA